MPTDKRIPEDKRLPHSLEAERAVLGSILLDNDCLSIALDVLGRDDWFRESHRLIWDQMVKLSGAFYPVDNVSLSDSLQAAGNLQKAGGPSYIASLSDGVPSGDHSFVRNYCRIVKEKSLLRRAAAFGQAVQSRAYSASETSQAILEFAQTELNALSLSQDAPGLTKMSEVARSLNFGTLIDGKGTEGLQTGFYDIDGLTCGLHPGELTLVAARPSVGKSALSGNIAVNVAKRGAKVALFSLEMSKESLLVRMICSEAKVDYHRIRSGWCTREDMGKVSNAIALVAGLPLWVDDTSAISVTRLRSRAWRLKQEFGLDLLIADFLQLLTVEQRDQFRRMNRAEEVGTIGKGLKDIAKDFGIPTIALAQLNREPEKGKKKREPQLTDLRESGELEQVSDNVWFLDRDEEPAENSESGIKVSAICRKQRNGPQGRGTLLYLPPYTRFENYNELVSDAKPVEG